MHGLNVVASVLDDDQTALEISAIFHSIQGEGPFTGMPAVFVRMAGCNLQCKFCDVDFEQVEHLMDAPAVVREVQRIRNREGPCGLVVLTGGEPLRQNVGPLITQLEDANFRVQVETAGTLWRQNLEDVITARRAGSALPEGPVVVCSPKTARLAPGIDRYIHALKYICRSGEMCVRDGLPVTNTQKSGRPEVRPARPGTLKGPPVHPEQVYIQPCYTGDRFQDGKNLVAATQIAMRKGFRLSIQVHRIARVPY